MSPVEFNQLLISNLEYIQPYSVFYTRDEENAKDLMQETLYRAIANREKYRNGNNIRGWLLTIMKNIYFNSYRRKQLEKRIFHHNLQEAAHAAQTGMAALQAGKATAPGARLQIKEIMAAVHELPENLRIPFYLQYEGYKYQEIAHIVDIAEGTIKSRIHLARKLLMKKVG